jgi:Rieske Fe-S protein
LSQSIVGSTTGGSTTGGSTTGGSTTGGSTTGGRVTGGTTGNSGSCAGTVDGGSASALGVGKAKRLESSSYDLWLCRESNGLYAMDNYCTHAGCAVSQQNGGFYCPCHGATFDFNGGNLTGPPTQPLNHVAVCVDDRGEALIDPTQSVDPSDRA